MISFATFLSVLAGVGLVMSVLTKDDRPVRNNFAGGSVLLLLVVAGFLSLEAVSAPPLAIRLEDLLLLPIGFAGVIGVGLALLAGRWIWRRRWPIGYKPVYRVGSLEPHFSDNEILAMNPEEHADRITKETTWFVEGRVGLWGRWFPVESGIRSHAEATATAEGSLRAWWTRHRQVLAERSGRQVNAVKPTRTIGSKVFK